MNRKQRATDQDCGTIFTITLEIARFQEGPSFIQQCLQTTMCYVLTHYDILYDTVVPAFALYPQHSSALQYTI